MYKIVKLIVLTAALTFASQSYACKLSQAGYANLIVQAAMNTFVEAASSDTVINQIIVAEQAFVDIRAKHEGTDLRSAYKVTVNSDCSTIVTPVKVRGDNY